MSKAVFCIANNQPQANSILEELRRADFLPDDISMLFADKKPTKNVAHDKQLKDLPSAAAGWLVGLGALAISGRGPLIAAGPLMAAFSAAAVGGTVGGVAAALIGMAIPEFQAKRYESRLEAGNILICVNTEDSDEVALAKSVFKNTGGEDIAVANEPHASRPDKDKNSL